MEERSDKRDSVALAASFSGIDFEWVNGVRGADIPIKSHPLVIDYYPKDSAEKVANVVTGLERTRE